MESSEDLKMEESFGAVTQLLAPFAPVIGAYLEKYQNHVCRVVANCLAIDNSEKNRNKYIIAGVFHDIGIWTNQTIDYLAPSANIATRYLLDSTQEMLIPEIIAMIHWHHKTTSYNGEYSNTVNTFRKADWIDVSFGLLSFDSDPKVGRMYRKQFPNRGFHMFLLKQLARNFFRHPLSPLPMFRL
jgi:hypothetical protein